MKIRVMAVVMVMVVMVGYTESNVDEGDKNDCGANKNSMIILVMRMMVETVDRGNKDDEVATAESDCNGAVIS